MIREVCDHYNACKDYNPRRCFKDGKNCGKTGKGKIRTYVPCSSYEFHAYLHKEESAQEELRR